MTLIDCLRREAKRRTIQQACEARIERRDRWLARAAPRAVQLELPLQEARALAAKVFKK